MTGWTCVCGASNLARMDACAFCNLPRRGTATAVPNAKPQECVVDGATLDVNGYCHLGDGWSLLTPRPPEVCPTCRQPFEWSGLCRHCSRAGGIAHGHRYELHDNGHWQLVRRGPAPLFTPEQNLRALSLVRGVLTGAVSEDQAHAAIDVIAAEPIDRVPF